MWKFRRPTPAIDELNRDLDKLWATEITKIDLDLKAASLQFHIVSREGNELSYYRLFCEGLAKLDLDRKPISWDYTELSDIFAKPATIGGEDGVALGIDLWSDKMDINCRQVSVIEVTADDA